MLARIKHILLIILISVIPTLAIWTPFFLRTEKVWGIPLPREGMATIVANYDGPLYLVVAKTFYEKVAIKENFPFGLPTEYYPAHFPLFPALIRLVGNITNYPYAMLIVTVASSVLAVYFFNKFIKDYVDKDNALWVTLVFSLFPARWLIVRSVGSAEPLFIAGVIASVYYFNKKNYLLSGIWGVVAQLTKSPGIILFIALLASYLIPKLKEAATASRVKWLKLLEIPDILPILLIPASLLGLFYFYQISTGDFLAYFHSGDNIHLFFPPFQIFNFSQPWVGTFWLEEVIFVYLFGLLGIMKLIKMKENSLSWFVGIYFVSIIFVSHRDIIRYALPIVPFLFAAFSGSIIKKDFKYVMLILIIPIFLFSLAYISQNVMPISNWAPLL